MKTNVCEWCGQTYPENTFNYFTVIVFEKEHKICEDCYLHLNVIPHIPEGAGEK